MRIPILSMLVLGVAGCGTRPAGTRHFVRETPATTAPVATASSTSTKSTDVAILVSRVKGTRGILVRAPSEISAAGAASPDYRFKYTLVNYLDEEVFVETPRGVKIGLTVETDDAYMGGGGTYYPFPNNVHPLIFLHATIYRSDGAEFTCGCAMTGASGVIANADHLSDFIGATARLTVNVHGILRKSGRAFSESVEVPVKIVK